MTISNRFTYLLFLSIVLLGAAPAGIAAQLVDYSGKKTCAISNGEEVVLFPASETPHAYYCLPAHLRLSVNEEKQPEFLMMLWAGEGETVVDNGIMHWLLTWGLTAEDEKVISGFLISKVDSNAVFLGAMSVSAPEKYLFSGKNHDMIALLQRSITSGGGIPTVTGGKSATSFKFKGGDAQTIEKHAKDAGKWKGVMIEMPFFGLNNEYLCTLSIDAGTILTAAYKCDTCFLIPEK